MAFPYRQIRNAFQAAIALAEYDTQKAKDGDPQPTLGKAQFNIVAESSSINCRSGRVRYRAPRRMEIRSFRKPGAEPVDDFKESGSQETRILRGIS
ncbi:hypothetical protein F5Y14DRAFT_429138 [Nemania sp. NC0429]|nr:hypothetical protein F5Y14DRAFT_429138 [Nemania sp. NC0429]